MVEAFGDFEVARIFPDGGEIGEDFVHAAKFGLQGALHLVFGETASAPVHPGGHLFEDIERLLILQMLVGIEQAGLVRGRRNWIQGKQTNSLARRAELGTWRVRRRWRRPWT